LRRCRRTDDESSDDVISGRKFSTLMPFVSAPFPLAAPSPKNVGSTRTFELEHFRADGLDGRRCFGSVATNRTLAGRSSIVSLRAYLLLKVRYGKLAGLLFAVREEERGLETT